jgi:H+/Cl- antiporter ClcA
MDTQLAAGLRTQGHIVDSPLRMYGLILMVCGACFGWFFGWLLTAFLPRKRLRTRSDYVLISIVGVLPVCMVIALLVSAMAIRHGSPHRPIHQTQVSDRSAPTP